MRHRDVIQAQYQYKAALEGLCRLIGADLTPALRSTEIVSDVDPTVAPSQSISAFCGGAVESDAGHDCRAPHVR